MSEPVHLAFTGAAGMLGRELVAATRERAGKVVAWDRDSFDLTDESAVLRAFEAARPRAVIHGAAWTDVDGCEADPQRAFLVNGRGTANLARACREFEARLVMVSTDYVFGGDKEGPYVESDEPGPLSVYGWSKLLGEEAVRELGPKGAIARTAWVYADHGQNFFLTMLRLAEDRDQLAVVDDQNGSPTFAADLAAKLIELAECESAHGVFHVTNQGATTWNGFAREIMRGAGKDVTVDPVSSDQFPRPARRPANSVLSGRRLEEFGLAEPPAWEDALARCFARRAAQE